MILASKQCKDYRGKGVISHSCNLPSLHGIGTDSLLT